MKYDVFISYSSKDQEVAQQLCKYLEDHDILCWMTPRNVTAGIPYAQAILDGIDESQLMLLLFSENANNSRHVTREVDRAFSKEKIIIPFRITDTIMSDVLSYYLSVNHYIDGIPDPSLGFDNLKKQIEKNLPDKQKDVELDEILSKLSKITSINIEEFRKAYEKVTIEKIKSEPLPDKIGTKGRYSIMQNAEGEIMLMMYARNGGPDNPRFIYDGSGTALLYRSKDSSVLFNNIDEEARLPLKKTEEILVVEVENDEVIREYIVSVRLVRNVEDLIKRTV